MTYRTINSVKTFYCDFPGCYSQAWRRLLEGSPFAFWGRLGAGFAADLCKEHYLQYWETTKKFWAKEFNAVKEKKPE